MKSFLITKRQYNIKIKSIKSRCRLLGVNLCSAIHSCVTRGSFLAHQSFKFLLYKGMMVALLLRNVEIK